MGMFSTREPRRYHHEYIYYNPRKEKLRKIEENARRELGLLTDEEEKKRAEETRNERIHDAILNGTKHLKRREERGGDSISYKWLFVLIFILLFVLHYLYTGSFRF